MGKIIYTSKSRSQLDWTCPRARWWHYHYNGRGIIPAGSSLELNLGIILHDALAAIAIQHQAGAVDIDRIAIETRNSTLAMLMANGPEYDPTSAEATFAWEQATLLEGIIRGYHKHMWPRLLAEYPTIVAVEREVKYKLRDGLYFRARPDLLMADKDGNWVYIEFKSTSSRKVEWVNSWTTAVQLHSGCKAVGETMGTQPSHVIVLGLAKGYSSWGRQNSPFCYAYKKNGSPPFSKDQVRYTYYSGFKASPTWELEGGVAKWVAEMPEEMLAEQFPVTPPIFVNEDLVAAYFRQLMARENDVEDACDRLVDPPSVDAAIDILDDVFGQRFDMCSSAYGRPCGYRVLCHSAASDDPLSHGFIERPPSPHDEGLDKPGSDGV